MQQRPRAFVLMPFAPEFTAIYTDLIRPALEDAGYEVVRADSFLDQQNILRDIVQGIGSAKLVVADLTALNPNVMYELGLCHGLNVPTVLLTQSIDEVPFDLRGYRMLRYATHFSEVHRLKEALQQIGERHIQGEITFGSPISDFLPTGLTLARPDTTADPSVSPEEAHPDDTIEEEGGFLDLLVEGDQAAAQLTQAIEEIAREIRNVGERVEVHTRSLNEVVESGGPGTAARAHRLALLAATDMTTFANNVDRRLPSLEESVSVLTDRLSRYVTLIEATSEATITGLTNSRRSVGELLEGARSGLEGSRSFRDTIVALTNMRVSREITRASRRMTQALDRIIQSLEQVEAFCVRIIGLIDEKLTDQTEQVEL